jgi:hypothetical protein
MVEPKAETTAVRKVLAQVDEMAWTTVQSWDAWMAAS